jgi:hypothetical protein
VKIISRKIKKERVRKKKKKRREEDLGVEK